MLQRVRLFELGDSSLTTPKIGICLGLVTRHEDFYNLFGHWKGRRLNREIIALAFDELGLHESALTFSKDSFGEIEISSPRVPLY